MTTEKNPMGTAPVNKVMLKMSIPMILSMMLQALYNIVDSAFVSNMAENGEEAMNALTLAFPVQLLMVALSIGTGVGVNALAAHSLGRGERDTASRAAGNGLFLSALLTIIFMLFGLFGAEMYATSQTTSPLILEMTVTYLRVCCCGCVGQMFFASYEKLLQATGHSLYSTIAQISGALINIVLDPIMIYGLLGFPEMGIAGAALATIIGQITSAVVGLIAHLIKNKEFDNSLKYWKPSAKIIGRIYAIGFPAIIAQALMSIMTYALNLILVKISESAVTAYGLYYKVQQFVLFAAFGMRDAITPIVSYNYGFGSKKRINDGTKYGVIYTIVIMLAGTLIVEIAAKPLVGAFGLIGETAALCLSAMRIASASFLFAGINTALQGVFQALGGGAESLIVSLCRQLIFVIPPAIIIAHYASGNADAAWQEWLVFPFAELVTAVISAALLKRIKKRRVDMLENN